MSTVLGSKVQRCIPIPKHTHGVHYVGCHIVTRTKNTVHLLQWHHVIAITVLWHQQQPGAWKRGGGLNFECSVGDWTSLEIACLLVLNSVPCSKKPLWAHNDTSAVHRSVVSIWCIPLCDGCVMLSCARACACVLAENGFRAGAFSCQICTTSDILGCAACVSGKMESDTAIVSSMACNSAAVCLPVQWHCCHSKCATPRSDATLGAHQRQIEAQCAGTVETTPGGAL